MTSTLTRPPAASPDDVAPRPAPPAVASWLGSGDHKRIGLLFLAVGLIAVVAGALAAGAFQVIEDRSAVHIWTDGDRLASAAVMLSLIIGVPAVWIGLASYLLPLQIGSTRLALPRLHSLALWTYGAGAVLAGAGLASDRSPIAGLASSVPAAARRGRADAATELMIGGLVLVALATFLAAVCLLTTVLNRRAEGMRLTNLALFSWSTLATSSVLVLATPVFLAGLVLLFYDHHYGGTLLASREGGRRIWQHQLWVLGQPMALLFPAACVGIFGDIVSSSARRPIEGFGTARLAAVAAPALTLALWAGNLSTLRSPFGPVGTIGGVLVGAPLGLSLLAWALTLRAGTPLRPGLFFIGAFLALCGLATVLSLAAVAVGVDGGDDQAFRNGQITLLVFGAPLVGLAGAIVHWSPKISGRTLSAGSGGLVCLLLLGGIVLAAVPGYVVGFGGDDSLAIIGAAGSAMTAAGTALLLLNVVGPRQPGSANPYGGLTLEWAAPSPPAAHNFDELPDIRSPYPLADDGSAG